MNRAFIFDMDGVLVDSERAWGDDEKKLLERMFGVTIAEAASTTVGISIQEIYRKARELGATIPYESFIEQYDEAALKVLAKAEITPGARQLVDMLCKAHFKLGLVSSSPQKWIDQVLRRLSFADKFDHIESVFEHPELKSKPAPDGYLDACRRLAVAPGSSFVLEDSNPGITAAKTAGCFVIGFRGNVLPGYEQTGADTYADTMEEVVRIVEKRVTRP